MDFDIFWRNVTDKVGNEKTLYYATSNNLCFCITCQNGETWKSHFSFNWIVLHTQCTCALSSWKKQEGQHPLTGQVCRQLQATGQPVSRMQASGAMTSRLPRYEAKCVQCSCFRCGSVPLRSNIKGRELPPANIFIPLERQLIALEHCRWEFLYNETLQQMFRPLLSKFSKRRQI